MILPGKMSRGLSVAAAVLLSASLAAPASATGCKLAVFANLPVTMEGLRASVPTIVNGHNTSFWLDSGAFFSIMPKAKAIELQLQTETLPPGFYISGIGGSAAVELTTIKSFGIVGQDIKNLQFLVGGSDAGNGLIGLNILALADAEFDLANGSVKLIKPYDCGKSPMSYWAPGAAYFTVPLEGDRDSRNHEFRLPIVINGAKIDAEMDTGAPMSLLSLRAAERAGIDVSGPDAKAAGNMGGIGRHFEKGWTVPVASIKIGDEEILRTHLYVIADSLASEQDAPDMLLGADFILAHHIYVSRSQHLVYFTYSGGKPFLAASPADPATGPAARHPLPAGKTVVEAVSNTVTPKTADEFARRGNARLSRQDVAGAEADLSEAIRISPDVAAYYRDRAHADLKDGKKALGEQDLDEAITLEPANAEFLRARSEVRYAEKNMAGALADADAAARITPPASLQATTIADLFVALGRPARAIPIYDAAIAAHSDDSALGELLNGRCWARGVANVELDKALADCNRAIRRDGATAQYLDSRGLVYFRKTNLIAAIADYDAALKADPQISTSLYLRGLAKIMLGQDEAGKADQAAAKAINPDIAAEIAGYYRT